jgi:hypothetical protein
VHAARRGDRRRSPYAGSVTAGRNRRTAQPHQAAAVPSQMRPGEEVRAAGPFPAGPSAAFVTAGFRLRPAGLRRARHAPRTRPRPGRRRPRSLDRPPPKTNAGRPAASDGKTPEQPQSPGRHKRIICART